MGSIHKSFYLFMIVAEEDILIKTIHASSNAECHGVAHLLPKIPQKKKNYLVLAVDI